MTWQQQAFIVFDVVPGLLFGPQTIYLICYQLAWLYPKNWLENSESDVPGKKALATSQVLFVLGWPSFGYYLWQLFANWGHPSNESPGLLLGLGVFGALALSVGLLAKVTQLKAEQRLKSSQITLIIGLFLIIVAALMSRVDLGVYGSSDLPKGALVVLAALLLHISFAQHIANVAANKGESRSIYFWFALLFSTPILWVIAKAQPKPAAETSTQSTLNGGSPL